MSDQKFVSSRPFAGPVNTRIAPSPSGLFHIGTARTAYHNWLAARASGGKFLVRIDDTNAEKSHQEYVDLIYDALKWLGLDHDATFRQSDRMDRYNAVIQELKGRGHAITVEGGAVALCAPDVPPTFFDNILGHVKVSDDDAAKCERMILVRSDGMPTYQFATVVDDHDYDINYVIRGQDHVSNTVRQVSVYRCLGWDVPVYAHVGLIHKDKKKMSKSDGAASLLDYRDKGYSPDAILNYLLRLGWGPYVDDKSANFIPKERALELFFDGGKLRPASSNYDVAKLDSLDRKYKALVEKK
jgi:glutamyl/glutaminyl-tRNA synthetase